MGFFDRLKNAWSIFILSWKYAGKDKSLLAIPIWLVALNIVFVLALIGVLLGAGLFVPDRAIGLSMYLIFALYLFCSLFVNVFLGAAQCWMVYEVTLGKDTTVWSGLKRAWKNLADIIWFSIVMFILKILTSKRGGRGIGSVLTTIFGGLIETLVRLAGKLVLPAMIVTERTFKEAVLDLQRSSKVWPEMLAFEAGAGPLFSFVGFFGFLIILFVFFLLYATGISLMLSIFIAVGLLVMQTALLSIARNFVDSTFHTLLYLALVEKKKIPELSKLYAPKGYWL
jgi:hypothetical protein